MNKVSKGNIMCKSIAEGGMRCAHHTGGPYRTALKAFKLRENESNTAELVDKATKYASTPSGAATLAKTLETLDQDTHLSGILTDSLHRGIEAYRENKKRSELLQQETRRIASVEWSKSLPSSHVADTSYRKLISEELDLDENTFNLAWEVTLSEAADNALDPRSLPHARYVVKDEMGEVSATPQDPVYLTVVDNFEKLSAYARQKKRSRADHLDDVGGLWIRYENDRLSEVLRCVDYNSETKDLNVAIQGKDQGEEHWYTYREVPQDIVDSLCSARSMGRFYAYVFSGLESNSALPYKSKDEVSFVVRISNNLTPIEAGAGPVPKDIEKRLTMPRS